MRLRVATTFALGLCAVPGCFNPDPTPLDPTTTTTTVGTSTGVAEESTGDESSGGCLDGCTTTGSECTEDCTLLDDDCNVGTCEEGACVAVPRAAGTECDDGLFCTENDACLDGVCSGAEIECPGEGGCTIGVCDEDADACGVEAVGEGDPCDDENPCTGDGICEAGACSAGPDECAALSTECAAGTCNEGVGCEEVPVNEGAGCDVANPCASSTCQAGSCVVIMPTNEGLGCEDGDFCTAGDACMGGVCTPGVAAACPEDDICGAWTCDEMMDTCILNAMNEGMPCDDGNLCTPPAATQCVMGECLQPAGGGPLLTYLWEDFADNSAGWAMDPEWEIGPTMVSMGGFPGADPAEDHTFTMDNGVGGVVIGGNATPVVHPPYYLTSPPMVVPPGEAAILGFYRWLNSDYDPFMINTVEVWDGASWVEVWASGPPPEVSDDMWTYVEHDLTAYANDSMRVRFGFEIAQDGVYTAPSWNVDDVLVSNIVCP